MKKALFIILGVVVLSVALLPQILSTSLGFKMISAFLPGTLTAKEAHFTWWGPQKAYGVRYQESDFVATAASVVVTSKNAQIEGGTLSFAEGSLTAISAEVSKDYNLEATGQTQYMGQTGQFTLSLALKNDDIEGSANLTAFPLIGLKTAIDLNTRFVAKIDNNQLVLKRPAQLNFKTYPFRSYGSATLETLSMPLKTPKKASFTLTANAPEFSDFKNVSLDLKTNDLSEKLNYNLRGSHFRSEGDILRPLKDREILTETYLKGFPTSHFGPNAVKLLGATLDLDLKGQIKKGVINAKGQINSPLLQTSTFDVRTNGTIELTQPFSLTYNLTPALLPGLKNNATLKGQFDKMSLSEDFEKVRLFGQMTSSPLIFDDFRLDENTAQFSGETAHVRTLLKGNYLQKPAELFIDVNSDLDLVVTSQHFLFKEVSVEDFKMKGHLNRDSGAFKSTLSFDVDGEKSGALSGTLDVDNAYDLKNSPLALDLKADNFPTHLISKKATLVGKEADFEAYYTRNGTKKEIDLDVTSKRFNLKGAFSLNDALTLKKGKSAKLEWKIDEESYLAFDRLIDPDPNTYAKHAIKVSDPAKFKAELKSLRWPLGEKEFLSPNLESVLLEAKVKMDTLTLNDIVRKESLSIKNLSGNLSKKRNSDQIDYDFSTDLVSGSEAGRVSFEGFMANFGAEGENALDEITTSFKGQIADLPSSFVDGLFRIWGRRDQPASALFGPSLYAAAEGQFKKFSGSTKLSINSSNFKGVIDAILIDRKLMLHSPIYAQIVMTEELSDLLSRGAGIRILSTREPIELGVDNRGFVLPFSPSTSLNFRWDTPR